MTVKVHRFASTGEAYDSSQTGYFPDDAPYDQADPMKGIVEVADGDVLVVESERAVAVMVEAWPVAISAAHAGVSFHRHDDTFDWARVKKSRWPGDPDVWGDYSASAELARAEAAKFNEGGASGG